MKIWLRYNLRSMPGAAATRDICQVALEQAAWADRLGFDSVALGEHHGAPDGFDPSPLVFGAALAARTAKLRIHVNALLLPLHDPVRIAEDAAMLDNISGGRLDLTLGIGYVPDELAMFGVAKEERARVMDEKLAVLRRALAGERFEYRGRPVYVTPRPVQQPGPPLFSGGAVLASALRAARAGDGFCPQVPLPELIDAYRQECAALGKAPGPVIDVGGPFNILVSEDPEATWARYGPYALHEMRSYSRWAGQGGARSPFSHVETVEQLRSTGVYQVLTPEQCLALARSQREANRMLTFHPLTAGMPFELSWASLELFAAKVLPLL
ncbi:MAG: LLM class flavin-dependent oxidoreductase [Gammaproteobacteria bacterium]|nr:LLM class flavin-dependent oxidoreductase [Gammaproteobacteria bacterium]